jgi:hypothetical protein
MDGYEWTGQGYPESFFEIMLFVYDFLLQPTQNSVDL